MFNFTAAEDFDHLLFLNRMIFFPKSENLSANQNNSDSQQSKLSILNKKVTWQIQDKKISFIKTIISMTFSVTRNFIKIASVKHFWSVIEIRYRNSYTVLKKLHPGNCFTLYIPKRV